MEEKRRHKRISIASASSLRFKNRENSPPIEAMVAKISISGIGLYTDKPIEKSSGVFLEIKFISADGNMYNESISGRIVYVNVLNGINYGGIEFNELINPIRQPHLHKHLMTALNLSAHRPHAET